MIATLRGIISEKLPASLVLEAGGVGYELAVTTDDWGAAKVGAEDKFYVVEQIREDMHNLFGFRTLELKQLFVQLLGVSSVGPKLALQILSSAGEKRLRQAIISGDPDLLKGVAGVGPKIAQRVMIELRGRVDEGSAIFAPVADPTYQALIALGYKPADASAAVSKLPADVTDDQTRLKLALKGVTK